AELALTVMLLVGAGLMLRSLDRVMRENRGMDTSRVGTLELTLGRGSRAERVAEMDGMLAALRATPGISAAGIVNDLPLNGVGGIALQLNVPGAPPPAPGARDYARYLMASGDYFAALGIPLLGGRTFASSDDSLAPKVAVVGKRMAERYWPGRNPVGQTFTLIGDAPITVVGVVADVRERKLEERAGLQMYLSVYNEAPRSFALVARSTLAPRELLARMTDAVHRVDRGQAVYNVRMMDDVVGASVAPRRTNTVLIAAFAVLALLLAAIGVYAVVSYSAAQRRREMGIRSALGATGSALVRLVAGEMVAVAAGGVAAGLVGAWMLSRVLASLLYGVPVHDPLTFGVVPLALLVPAAIATLVPARRAMRVNPAEVMRAD
ncbi:MAG TPA: FtsX-like permease family protein, partial [Gemmatimonadaceae bacterium]|nr:FtsX-like permease family protein [Gemmatimonadaceae bacterium]